MTCYIYCTLYIAKFTVQHMSYGCVTHLQTEKLQNTSVLYSLFFPSLSNKLLALTLPAE